MRRSSKQNEEELFTAAEGQQGYFTTKQAKACGYPDNTHPYHVAAGNWVRERRGIYRLSLYPISEEGQLVICSLWSRNRKGVTQGTYSHQTALSIHDVSDVMPSKLHMTVPVTFRRSSPIPPVLILHKAFLPDSDIEERMGYRVTRLLRTLVDLIDTEEISADELKQVLEEGLRRGLITRSELRDRNESVRSMDTLRCMAEELKG